MLNERGAVDPDHVAELLHGDVDAVIAETRRRDLPRSGNRRRGRPPTPYLSGAVRSKLATARAAAESSTRPSRATSRRSTRVQPADSSSLRHHRAPRRAWIPAADIIAFVQETMDAEITIHHMPELACWTVNARQLEWTRRRHHRNGALIVAMPAQLLSDALNSSIPQIFDTMRERRQRAAHPQHGRDRGGQRQARQIKTALSDLDLVDPDRTDRLARLYNDTFNNIVPRHLRRIHLATPGRLWRLFSLWAPEAGDLARSSLSGSTYARPRRRRRQDAVDRGRDHGAAPARPDQQGDAGRARPLPGAGRARVPGALSEAPASSSPTRPIS